MVESRKPKKTHFRRYAESEVVSDARDIEKRIVRGKIITVLGVVALLISSVVYVFLMHDLFYFQHVIDPAKPFINPYSVDSYAGFASLPAYLSAVIMFHGILLVRKPSSPPKDLPWLLGIIVGAIFIAIGWFVYSPATDVLLKNQHSWAEQRYGITYDEIVTYGTRSIKHAPKKWQGDVISDGKPIARVCDYMAVEIRFCEPGTIQELNFRL